eukprot:UN09199
MAGIFAIFLLGYYSQDKTITAPIKIDVENDTNKTFRLNEIMAAHPKHDCGSDENTWLHANPEDSRFYQESSDCLIECNLCYIS